MQVCPDCHAENPDTARHCQQCGFKLMPESTATRELTPLEGVTEWDARKPIDRTVRLEIEDFDEPLIVKMEEQVMLGRHGGEGSDPIFINLEPYNAIDKGVSRRHAMLIWQDDHLFIADLDSVNHTYINGLKLPERREFPLREGDMITLGDLNITLYFE